MIKDLLPNQTVCNQKNQKGKSCLSMIKRYYPFASYYNEPDQELLEEIRHEFGENQKLILLKCEVCNTVYRLPEVLRQRYALKL